MLSIRISLAFLAGLAGFAFIAFASAQILELPQRLSPRPATTPNVPHIQLNADVFPALNDALILHVDAMPGVVLRETLVSLPGAVGFWVANDVSITRPQNIVAGREFAHMHPDGSLHASLSPEQARLAVQQGWAIPHPWAAQRPGWEGFVMIYSPTSAAELEVVQDLVQASFDFVTGTGL